MFISFISILICWLSFLCVLFVVLSPVALGVRLGCLRFFLFPKVQLYCCELCSYNCFCYGTKCQRFWIIICLFLFVSRYFLFFLFFFFLMWTIFKVLVVLQYCVLCFVFLATRHVGFRLHNQVSNPQPLCWMVNS